MEPISADCGQRAMRWRHISRSLAMQTLSKTTTSRVTTVLTLALMKNTLPRAEWQATTTVLLLATILVPVVVRTTCSWLPALRRPIPFPSVLLCLSQAHVGLYRLCISTGVSLVGLICSIIKKASHYTFTSMTIKLRCATRLEQEQRLSRLGSARLRPASMVAALLARARRREAPRARFLRR